MTQPNPDKPGTENLPDLDDASLACMQRIAKLASISRSPDNLGLRNSIQVIIREAMRAVLPLDDPRRDPDHPSDPE